MLLFVHVQGAERLIAVLARPRHTVRHLIEELQEGIPVEDWSVTTWPRPARVFRADRTLGEEGVVDGDTLIMTLN